jgi:hypothetical protein
MLNAQKIYKVSFGYRLLYFIGDVAAKNKNKPDCQLFSAKLKELYSVLE